MVPKLITVLSSMFRLHVFCRWHRPKTSSHSPGRHDTQGRPHEFFPGGHRRRKGSVVGGHHGECGARAYNRGSGAEPPAGSRGIAPGQGIRGAKPPEAESSLVIGCPTEPANLAPFQKCICISTLGATVMIWENLCRNQGGSGDPPCPFLGAPMTTQTILLFCCV